MLFMILVKASTNSENENIRDKELMKLMDDYNDQIIKAKIRVMAKGLHPSKEGMRIYFDKSNNKIIENGPFKPTKDVIAGFFLIEVDSKKEAIEWFNKVPDPQGNGEGIIELREVY